jgi:hypothetical protein
MSDNGKEFTTERDLLRGKIIQLAERGKVSYLKDDYDSIFRFIVSDDKEAIFWLLEDEAPEAVLEEREKGLRGGGFTSDRGPMIQILNNIFEKTKKNEPPDETRPT